MKIDKQQIRGLVKSFLYAFRGLWLCIRNERNMRIHLVVAVVVTIFSLVFGLTALEYAVLILAMGFVIVADMVNTAIEALVDLQSPAYDSLARIAKDVAAGAVLIAAGVAVLVGIGLFWKPQKLLAALACVFTSPFLLILFAVLITAGTLFIFKGTEMFRLPKGKSSRTRG